ncbi:MAG: flavodoxin domain-containing protein [Candidatus Thorarchaeota archaeon]
MSKTLVAYGTRYGATAEVAEEIAKILQEQFDLIVNIVNLDIKFPKGKELAEYQNIIIGSGIKVGMWTNRAKRFLKSNFEGKKIAVYVCSRRAGEPDLYEYAYSKYIEEVLNKNLRIKPIAAEAFGGRKPLKNDEFYENRDWDKIRGWAKKVGELFSS